MKTCRDIPFILSAKNGEFLTARFFFSGNFIITVKRDACSCIKGHQCTLIHEKDALFIYEIYLRVCPLRFYSKNISLIFLHNYV